MVKTKKATNSSNLREQLLACLERENTSIGWLANAAQEAGIMHSNKVYCYLRGDSATFDWRVEGLFNLLGYQLRVAKKNQVR